MKQKLTAIFLAFYFILGSHRGYLALFEAGASEPRQIYYRKLEELPQEDQNALTEGIIIRNVQRLEQLLEDYLS